MANQIQVVRHARHQVAGAHVAEETVILALDHIVHACADVVQHLLAVLFQQNDHHIAERQAHHLNCHHHSEYRQQFLRVFRRYDFVNQLLRQHWVDDQHSRGDCR